MGGFTLSFYSIALVVGILCGLLLLLVLFTLLSMAQREDAYPEKMTGMSRKNRRVEKGQTDMGD
jgi:hypothetical protein